MVYDFIDVLRMESESYEDFVHRASVIQQQHEQDGWKVEKEAKGQFVNILTMEKE